MLRMKLGHFFAIIQVMGEKTVIIFGVSGFVGSNLAEILGSGYKIVGTYYKNRVSIPNALTIPCNVLNKDEVLPILFTFRPDVAIYCASASSLLECSENEASVNAVNTTGIFNVMEGCQRYHIQVCYISSNYVFAGKKKIYRETDTPDANTIYGKNQGTIEFYLQKTGLNYTIFRVCRMYGMGINPYRLNFFEYLQKMFNMKESVDCDHRFYQGFLDIHYLATILRLCFEEKVSNRLFQVSSSDIIALIMNLLKSIVRSFLIPPPHPLCKRYGGGCHLSRTGGEAKMGIFTICWICPI